MMGAPPQQPPRRVVIVDDTDDLRELLRVAFERSGYAVVGEAGDGEAAIAVVAEHRPDVVLLDLAMPVLDGLEALPTIRALVPDGVVLVLSGFGSDLMAERALSLGADGYVEKGAPLRSVVSTVRDLLAGARLAPEPGSGSGSSPMPG